MKGISIGKEETKLLQYADDTTAVLVDENSALAFLSLVDSLKDISGLKINCTKADESNVDWIFKKKTNQNPSALSGPVNPSKP